MEVNRQLIQAESCDHTAEFSIVQHELEPMLAQLLDYLYERCVLLRLYDGIQVCQMKFLTIT